MSRKDSYEVSSSSIDKLEPDQWIEVHSFLTSEADVPMSNDEFADWASGPGEYLFVVRWGGEIRCVIRYGETWWDGRTLAVVHTADVHEGAGVYEYEEALLRLTDSPMIEGGAACGILVTDEVLSMLETDPFELGYVPTVIRHGNLHYDGALCDWDRDSMRWWSERVAPIDIKAARRIIGHPEDLTHGVKYKYWYDRPGSKEGVFDRLDMVAGKLCVVFASGTVEPWGNLGYIVKSND